MLLLITFVDLLRFFLVGLELFCGELFLRFREGIRERYLCGYLFLGRRAFVGMVVFRGESVCRDGCFYDRGFVFSWGEMVICGFL